MDDQSAISRIKQGDPGGLEALVRTYQVRAVYAAFLITHDRSLAEDVAQNAFVRVVEKIDQFKDDRPFAPWFFKIVVNAAIKVARSQKRLAAWDEEDGNGTLNLDSLLMDVTAQPDKLFEIEESRQALKAALVKLTPEQRAAVVMRYYLEMSAADMAARAGRPVSTVKWWLRSARERLVTLLKADRYFEDRE